MRPSRSTSATSPRRAAPSSVPMIVLERLAALRCLEVGDPPAVEADDEVAHDGPVDQHERLRRGHRALRALGIGRGEDLLGREVGHVLDPVDGLEARGAPARGGQQADRQVGPGTLVVQRVEAAVRDPLGGADEHVGARPPGRDRVLLVEPQHVQQLLFEPFEPLTLVEVAEDEVGPDLRRAGTDRPVQRAVVDDPDALLDRRQPVLADERGIEVCEQAGRARP